ncbi:capsular biosynthesis protein [Helicobacter labetoulli]
MKESWHLWTPLHKAKAINMKRHILILVAANISTCPRPMRILEALKDEIKQGKYEVSVMGIDNEDGSAMAKIPHIATFSYPYYKKRNFFGELRLWLDVMCGRWDRLSFIKNRLVVKEHIKTHRYDVIICHDLLLLPVLFAGLDSKSNRQEVQSTRVIFDAREFYPLQNTSSLRWRLLFKAFNTYLCKTYAKRADKIFSVSPRFCELYKGQFGLKAELLLSLPPYYELNAKPINPQKIKILYHGALNKNRDIHKIIYLCQKLDGRFCIDFIFTGGTKPYRKKIESAILRLQKQGCNVRVLPAVSLEQIVPFGNDYDIGFIYIPQHNHNLLATIPNKFFEYIQSRLALLFPPIESLQDITQKYDNAIISRDFSLDSMAQALNTLSIDEIMRKKQSSHTAALELNINQNIQKIRNTLTELLS